MVVGIRRSVVFALSFLWTSVHAAQTKARSVLNASQQEVRWRAVVLNLHRREDRLKHFAESVSQHEPWLKERMCRLSSPDGHQLTNEKSPFAQELLQSRRVDAERLRLALHFKDSKNGGLTPGAIGCYLAHWEAWQLAIAENLDYVLVFEDDADWFASNFKSSFDGLLDDVRRAPENPNDLVYFQNCQDDQGVRWNWEGQSTRERPETNATKIARPRRVKSGKAVVCTAAYLLSRRGAEILSAKAFPMDGQLDFVLRNFDDAPNDPAAMTRWIYAPPLVQVAHHVEEDDSDVQLDGAQHALAMKFFRQHAVQEPQVHGSQHASVSQHQWLPQDCKIPSTVPEAWPV